MSALTEELLAFKGGLCFMELFGQRWLQTRQQQEVLFLDRENLM
jgi:hypothetical protein